MNTNYTFRCTVNPFKVRDALEALNHFQTVDLLMDDIIMVVGKWYETDVQQIRKVIMKHSVFPITLDCETDCFTKAEYLINLATEEELYYHEFDNNCENCGELFNIPDNATEIERCYCHDCHD